MIGAIAKIDAAAKSPTYGDLEAARAYDPGLTADEYALGRVVVSEFGRGTPTEMACIADAVRTKAVARGRTIAAHITAGAGFGEQGHGSSRPVSSRQDPGPRHLEAAIAVLRRGFLGVLPPPLVGLARGATSFFDPKSQASQSVSDPSINCPPLVILEAWTFDKAHPGCKLAERRGPAQLEWIGPVAGVDAYQLMLLRPATTNQAVLYAEARKVIESRGAYKAPLLPLLPTELGTVLLLVGASYLLSRGWV